MNAFRAENPPPSSIGIDTTLLTQAILKRHPSCDAAGLSRTLGALTDVFASLSLSNRDNLNSSLSENDLITLHLKPATSYALFDIHLKSSARLRTNCFSVFDQPSSRFYQEIDQNGVFHESRRVLFTRLTSKIVGANPMIISRWNFDSGPHFLQYAVALADQGGGIPRTLVNFVVSETQDERPITPIFESAPVPESQKEVYWKLIFQIARKSIAERRYPYTALIVPTGNFNPIIVAANGNNQLGQPMTLHAEARALLEMNHRGYKVGFSGDDFAPDYEPTVYSLVELCPSCSLMAREQRVRDVRFALAQPPGWSGRQILEDNRLNRDCGLPPHVIQDVAYLAAAREIIKEANSSEHFRWQFEDTIAANRFAQNIPF